MLILCEINVTIVQNYIEAVLYLIFLVFWGQVTVTIHEGHCINELHVFRSVDDIV